MGQLSPYSVLLLLELFVLEMSQRLQAFLALWKDVGLVHSFHITDHKPFLMHIPGQSSLFICFLQKLHTCGTHTYTETKHVHSVCINRCILIFKKICGFIISNVKCCSIIKQVKTQKCPVSLWRSVSGSCPFRECYFPREHLKLSIFIFSAKISIQGEMTDVVSVV